eukprot:2528992-Rhodomonas_salina.2
MQLLRLPGSGCQTSYGSSMKSVGSNAAKQLRNCYEMSETDVGCSAARIKTNASIDGESLREACVSRVVQVEHVQSVCGCIRSEVEIGEGGLDGCGCKSGSEIECGAPRTRIGSKGMRCRRSRRRATMMWRKGSGMDLPLSRWELVVGDDDDDDDDDHYPNHCRKDALMMRPIAE